MTTLLLGNITRRLLHSIALPLAAAAAFAVAPASIQFATGGMETSVFTCLVIVAVAVRQFPNIWPVVIACATMGRPEGFLLAGVLTVDSLSRNGRSTAARSAAIYLAA